jgi:uncharacterized protein YecE (DUF72 family)
MKFYISGPMTGIPDSNVAAFNAAAQDLRARGYEIVNPAEMLGPVNEQFPRSFYLRQDLEELLDCGGIFLLPGWERSIGAVLECEIAKQLGLEIHLYA